VLCVPAGFVAGDGHAKFKQHIADSLKDAGGPGSLQSKSLATCCQLSTPRVVAGRRYVSLRSLCHSTFGGGGHYSCGTVFHFIIDT
jgi:hypothetical protein